MATARQTREAEIRSEKWGKVLRHRHDCYARAVEDLRASQDALVVGAAVMTGLALVADAIVLSTTWRIKHK